MLFHNSAVWQYANYRVAAMMGQPLVYIGGKCHHAFLMKKDGDRIRAVDLEGVSVAAQRLGITRRRLYQMIDDGTIDYYEFGKRKMLRKRDINRLIVMGWEGKRKRETTNGIRNVSG